MVCEALSPALISVTGDTNAVRNSLRNHTLNVMYKPNKMRASIQIYILLVIISLVVFTSCKREAKLFDANGQVVIAGKIINHEKYPDIFTVKIVINELGNPSPKTHTTYLDKNGSFVFRFEKYNPQDIFFKYGKHISIFVSPGDSLYLKINAEKFIQLNPEKYDQEECIEFSGSSVQINKNLNSFMSGLAKMTQDKGFRTYKEASLPPNEYKSYLIAEREERKEFLETFIKSHQPSQTFIKWAQYFIDYDCGYAFLHYAWYHPFSQKRKKSFEVMDLPEDYFSFLDQLQLDNKPAFNCSQYYWFLHEHSLVLYDYKSQFSKKKMQKGRNFTKSKEFQPEYSRYLNGLINQYSGAALEHLLSVKLYSLLEHHNRMDVFEELYPKYKNTINECFRKINQQKYAELKGEEKNFEKENKTKTCSVPVFQQVLEKHKGKVIYIDILATWCGPCIMELPYSEKLKEEFNGKDVVFVYFCVKSKKQKWESIISDYKIKGDPYLLTDSQYDILSEKFQIAGIPRYILVNKEGTVVDKNAMRPSFKGELNANLIKEINQLINE